MLFGNNREVWFQVGNHRNDWFRGGPGTRLATGRSRSVEDTSPEARAYRRYVARLRAPLPLRAGSPSRSRLRSDQNPFVPVPRHSSPGVPPTEMTHEAGQVDRRAAWDQRVGVRLARDEVDPELQAVQPPADLVPDVDRERVRVAMAGAMRGRDVPNQVLERQRFPISPQTWDPVDRTVQQIETHQVHRMRLVRQPREESLGIAVPHRCLQPFRPLPRRGHGANLRSARR